VAKKVARKRPAKSKTATRKTATRKTATRKTATRKTAVRAAATRRLKKRKPAPKPSRLAAAATLVRGTAASAVAAIAQRLPWAANENDPIALLEADHRRFEGLVAKGEETTERAAKGRSQLLEMLTSELNEHELIEEKILYPALAPHAQAREIVLEGYQEHHVADLMIKELHEVATNDERWGAKFKVLKENLEHHIKEEEREMFPTARAVVSRDELDALGAKMKAMKKD
jgi:hypothetical protein